MRNMQVDPENKTFVGPCCLTAQPTMGVPAVEYGVEFSSHMGLKAYVTYNGLTMEFKKTREELKAWTAPKKVTVQPPPEIPMSEPANQKEMPN